jgi:hypothetical protein
MYATARIVFKFYNLSAREEEHYLDQAKLAVWSSCDCIWFSGPDKQEI